MIVILLLAWMAAAVQATAAPQTSQAQTAVLAGTVTTSGSGSRTPVASAIVTVAGASEAVSVSTDSNGSFRVDRLPAGSYSVTVSKPAFLTTVYGATRADPSGIPVVLAAGEQRQGIDVDLPRGAVVAGFIRDERGAPASHVVVSLFNAKLLPGAMSSERGSAQTNDRGEYRFFGLPPGDYIVGAMTGMADAPALSGDQVDTAIQALRRGERDRLPSMAAPAALPPRTSQTTIFYPGTAVARDATVLSLHVNEERQADFALQSVVFQALRGTVMGVPPGLSAPIVISTLDPMSLRPLPPVSRMTADPAGHFDLSGVAPGLYRIDVRLLAPFGDPATPDGTFLGAAEFVYVGLTPPPDVTLNLQPMLPLSGRVVIADSSARTFPRVWVGLQRAMIDPADHDIWEFGATSDAQGAFKIGDALPGAYRVLVRTDSDPAKTWRVVDATIGGRDVLDGSFDLSTELVAAQNLVVTIDDRPSGLTGRLDVASGTRPDAFQIVAFAADERYWRHGSRRIRAERVRPDGTYALADLPPGDYFLGVVTADLTDEVATTDFLRQLAPASTRVTVKIGEQTSQNLRVR